MPSIAVIDYDMGNLHSVCKGLEKVGGVPQITDRAADILAADAVLLPGVGAFDPAMQHLESRQLAAPICTVIESGKPFLGICLGLQILFEGSAEGDAAGLGIFPGRVERFRPEPGLTIPHMGWNHLDLTQPECPLWQDLPNDWMYFVHSYHVVPIDRRLNAATITHGSQTVTAAIAQANVMAVQFHPEKSSASGLKVLANFVELVNRSTLAAV